MGGVEERDNQRYQRDDGTSRAYFSVGDDIVAHSYSASEGNTGIP